MEEKQYFIMTSRSKFALINKREGIFGNDIANDMFSVEEGEHLTEFRFVLANQISGWAGADYFEYIINTEIISCFKWIPEEIKYHLQHPNLTTVVFGSDSGYKWEFTPNKHARWKFVCNFRISKELPIKPAFHDVLFNFPSKKRKERE